MRKKPHPVDVFVGNRVKRRREALDISQGALGKAIGRSLQQVQKYEKAYDRISASVLWEISRQLGVPVSYFFEDFD